MSLDEPAARAREPRISRRLARRIAEVMPLDQFPDDMQQRIAEAVAMPKPPPKYRSYGAPGERPLAQIISRAWHEWYWQRGINPDVRRPGIQPAVRAAVIARDGYVCQLCGGDVEPSDVHLDHRIPYSKGGPHTAANLQVAHSSCNLLKGANA